MQSGEDIVRQANEAMAAVRSLLTDENIARVTRIIGDLETISSRLAEERSVINQSGEAAAALADAATSIRTLADQTQRDLAELDVVLSDVQSAAAVASGETLPEISLAAEEFRRAADAITRVANSIDENPSVLTPQSPRPTVELRP